MDDERKVKPEKPSTDLVERSKLVFLQEIVREFRQGQEQYDLEKEFAKTRRNRSLLVPLVTLGLVVVFGLVAFGVTRFIQRSSLSIQVNIEDFADVNLREILDEAQRLQNQLAAAQRELEVIVRDRDTRISQLERNRERAIGLLGESDLTAGQRASRAQALRQEADIAIQNVRAETEPAIEELEARIAELQDAIAQYDTRQLEQAREQEEVLNNQQRLFELEMSAMRQDYEDRIALLTRNYDAEIQELEDFQAQFERNIRARHAEELSRLRTQHARELADLTLLYNPPLTEAPIAALLEEAQPAGRFSGPAPWRTVLGRDGGVGQGSYAEMVQQHQAVQLLLERLQEVPYQNGIPMALQQIQARTDDLFDRYERMWQQLGSAVERRDGTIAARERTIQAREARIDQYRFALEELTWAQGDVGYVIDPRDANAILVYLNPLREVDRGTQGFVFRRDNEFIGTIRFDGSGQEPTARVVDLEEGMTVRPFDRVLIRVQEDE